MNIRFFVPGIPQTAGSKKAFRHRYTKKIIVKDDNEKGAAWRHTVQWEAKREMAKGIEIFKGPLAVTFTFMLPRPKGHFDKYGRVKKSAPIYPVVRPDALKLSRAAEDALTGICWNDDSQIVIERLIKEYSDGTAAAGCLVFIQKMES